jgi:RHS repeat-associated protein
VGSAPIGVAVHPDINLALVTDNGPDGGKGGTNPGVLELVPLDYPIPTISQLSPANVVAGGADFTLMIDGSKFFSTSVVAFDDTALETNFINSRQLSVQVPAALIAQAKIAAITVTNPEPAGGTSDPATFTINNPVPSITQLTPNELTAGGPDFELTVTGTGFVSGAGGNSVVLFNNVAKPTTFVSATQLKAQIAAADIASPGMFPVTVTNPQPDGTSSNSNTANFRATVVLPPRVDSFSPGNGPAGTPVTITGANFVSIPPSTSVTFAGSGDTRVTAVIAGLTNTAITTAAPLGAVTGKIRVTTRGGSAVSSSDFTVTLPMSYTVTATPAMAEVPQGDGTNFDVRVESRDRFTGLVSLSAAGLPTGVSAQFNPAQLAPGGSATLQVRVDRSAATGQVAFRVQGQADISGSRVTREANLSLEIISGNLTTASGRVVTSDDMPRSLVDVEVSVVRFVATPSPGHFETLVPAVRTNAAGNFLLRNVPTGRQMLLVNGATARDPQSPERRFPPVEEPVTVVDSRANPTPFTIHLPAIDQTSRTATPPNPPQDIPVTTRTIPNLEVRIPAGTTIMRPEGGMATEVTLTPVATDRAPGLLPPGVVVPMLFSIQPGGAVPSLPVPVSFPNLLNTSPGTRMDLWTFDVSISAWRIYGTGTVSPDSKQVVPDTDPTTGRPYGLRRFAWHFPAPPPCRGDRCCRGPECCPTGDPVALVTGTFFDMKTDLRISGRIPISVARIYQAGNTDPGPFGIGTLDLNYGHRIQQEGASFLYIDPGSRAFRFTQIPGRSNQFENTTDPSLQGAVLTREAGEFSFTLRIKDGTMIRFDRIIGFVGLAASSAITDRNGNTIQLTRISPGPGPERFGLLTEIRDPDGRTLRLDYDVRGRVTTVTDLTGRQVTYAYSAAGYLETVTNAEGGVTRYRYDAQGRMTEIINPRGLRELLNEYDGEGRIIQQTNADGGAFRYEYKVVGGLIAEVKRTDPRGGVITHRFNCMGYPIGITDANGQTTLLDRSLGTNRINFRQNPLGRKVEYRYDERGNLIEAKDLAGDVLRLEYEPNFNRVTRIIDQLGNMATRRYDSRGNLLETIDPEGNSTTYTYNNVGLVTTTRDALGNVTAFEYDARGNLTAIIDPEGNRTSQSYDALGRLVVRTDPRGQKTRFVYDTMDRIIKTTYPNGGSTQFTYDANGNRLTTTDALGHTIANTYNSRDRLERRTDPLGNSDVLTYDQNGNRIRFTDRRGQVSNLTYDGVNRLIRTMRSDGITELTYDTLGRVVRVNDSVSGGVELGYDVSSNLIREVTPQGAITYEYDAVRRRTRMRVAGQPDVTYRYDRIGQLKQIQQGSDTILIDYDRLGRRTKLILPNGVATEYAYDRSSRLTRLTYKRPDGAIIDAIDYGYDGAGNFSNIRGAVPYRTPPAPVAVTEYNQANQLVRFGNKRFTYDQMGNLQSETSPDGTISYQWDTRNRLVSISGPNIEARFTYDALGRRIRKEINGQSTSYLYDEINIVQELSGSRVLAAYLRGLRIDEVFTRVDETGKTHYLADALRSTLFLTDDRGGRVQDYVYDAFGRVVQQSGTIMQPFIYTGREWDAATGLYYYRARYYNPTVGRFLAEDPLNFRFSGDNNSYVYALNNPIRSTDPLGLFTWDKSCTCELGDDLTRDIGDIIERACKVNLITDLALKKCVEERCHDSIISCDADPKSKNCEPGRTIAHSFDLGQPVGDFVLCPLFFIFFPDQGNIAIHELAHTCGWSHGDGKGVPGDSGYFPLPPR